MAIENLADLAELAHRALYCQDSEYARTRAFIAHLFAAGSPRDYKEETRLTVIDSLYSTRVAQTLWCGLPDIAQALRAVSPDDDVLREHAAHWVADGFTAANPLHGLFAAQYGINNRCPQGRTALSLLSKYLHFVTHGDFPIYDKLGATHYDIAGAEKIPEGFMRRFQVVYAIMDNNKIASFEKLDNFFWLYGKIQKRNFSLILNKEHLMELLQYTHSATNNADIIDSIRAGTAPAGAQAIFGPDLYNFIHATSF